MKSLKRFLALRSLQKTKTLLKGAALFLLSALVFAPNKVLAVHPIEGPVALVAGDGYPGYLDGSFTSAYFNHPRGLAVQQDSSRIFIADTANNRIRVIQLDNSNAVSTVAGQGAPGKLDGPFNSATFNKPKNIVCLQDKRLIVNDSGNNLLRVVDLEKGTVSTLIATEPSDTSASQHLAPPSGSVTVSMAGIMDMAYDMTTESLIFSQPDQLVLRSLDLKTMQVTKLLERKEGVVHPGAVCVAGGKIYVADFHTPGVFLVDRKPGEASTLTPVEKTVAEVRSLGGSVNSLYVFQCSVTAPVVRILPTFEPLSFGSVWGQDIPNPGGPIAAITNPNPNEAPSFVVDPQDSRKLYFVNPQTNLVSSVRDLMGGKYAGESYTPQYPDPKPPRTFRVLLVGDSRMAMIVASQFKDTPYKVDRFPEQFAIFKQMEMELNSLAALEDGPVHFQAISYSHSASLPLFLWPYYEIPAYVQAHDIDLVLLVTPTSPFNFYPYEVYYTRPMTKEGIPANQVDPEYLLKSAQERIPKGEAQHFFELCKKNKLVKIDKKNIIFNENLQRMKYGINISKQSEPEMYDSVVQLLGKPLDMLNQKLSGMRNSSGEPVKFLFCYTPTGALRVVPEDVEIWKGVTQNFHIPFLDLSPEMKALRSTYFPLCEDGGSDHFSMDGSQFFGQLLAHVLVRDGLVPGPNGISNPQTPLPTPGH